jgi:hypothetical protein
MREERATWEEESNIMVSTMLKPPAPPVGAPDLENVTKEEPNRESSTSGDTAVERARQGEHTINTTSV